MKTWVAGMRKGAYTLIRTDRSKGRTYWLARCDCGVENLILPANKDSFCCMACKGENQKTHGMYRTRTHRSWESMKRRVSGKAQNSKYWADVSICKAWLLSFENFLADMGERPEGTSIDRINPFGNYEPMNCRWATPTEQQNNLRIHA